MDSPRPLAPVMNGLERNGVVVAVTVTVPIQASVLDISPVDGSGQMARRGAPTEDSPESSLEFPGCTSVDEGIETTVEVAEPEEQVKYLFGDVALTESIWKQRKRRYRLLNGTHHKISLLMLRHGLQPHSAFRLEKVLHNFCRVGKSLGLACVCVV